MGHELVTGDVSADVSLLDGFLALAREHGDEYGHSHSVMVPYDRYNVFMVSQSPVLPSVAYGLVSDAWGKYGSDRYYAVPLVHESNIRRRKVTRKIRLSEDNFNRGSLSYTSLRATIQDQINLREGEQIERFDLVYNEGGDPLLDITTKVTAVTNPGKAETRYFVHALDRDLYIDKDTWGGGHATQAAARAAAIEKANSPHNSRFTEYGVTAITRRASGEPLVSMKRTFVRASATVEVTLAKTVGALKPGGYCIGLDCHH